MRLVVRPVLLSLALALAPPSVGASSEDATPSPGATAERPVLWLRGPFGTVPSGDDEPLDAYVRSAPLRLETGDPDVGIAVWRASFRVVDPGAGSSGPAAVQARDVEGGGDAAGGATIAGPDEAGTYRLEADATLSDGSARRRRGPSSCPTVRRQWTA
jgi:hypothetical protein